MRRSLDQQEYNFLLDVLDMHFNFISLSISYVSLSIRLQVEPECQQHLQVERSSSKSMEGISLPLVWRVKAKSSSSYIPFLGSIGILSFRFKRFGKFAFHANNKTYLVHANNKTCLVLWIFCKMVFESTTKTTPTSAFKRIKSFPLQGIDVSASWITFNRLRPRLSAHFMNQTISRGGLRKWEELPARSCSSIWGIRSFRQARIVWSQICCVGLLLSCLSELMSFKCDVYLPGKSVSSNFNAFAFYFFFWCRSRVVQRNKNVLYILSSAI